METINILGSFASITSLIISIIVLNKVKKIDKSTKQDIKGNDNIVSGRDSNIKR